MSTYSTRDRLVAEALRLFATRGYRGTSTAMIEDAAGLSPGSGGLYKHFRSKEALLEEALNRRIDALDVLSSVARLLPLGDLRSELTLLARLVFEAVDSTEDLLRVVERDGDQVPDVRARVGDRVIQRSYAVAAELLAQLAGPGTPERDWHGVSCIALGSILEYHRTRRLYGAPPNDVSEERFVAAWVDTMVAVVESGPPQPDDDAARARR